MPMGMWDFSYSSAPQPPQVGRPKRNRAKNKQARKSRARNR